MTKRALIKTSKRSQDTVHQLLTDGVAAADAVVAGERVQVFVEPLLKRRPDGSRAQSLRVLLHGPGRSEGTVDPVSIGLQIRTVGGATVPTEPVDGPPGSVRVLIPEVADPQELILGLVGLDPTRTIPFRVDPQREWTIHLVHHSHLDIGYTDPQGRVRTEQVQFLDSALDLIEETSHWPEEAQFRWVVESLWVFDKWREVRPAAVVERMMDQVRQGRIELTALPYNLHTDTCSTDELHELLRLARDIGTRYDVQLPVAMQTDVPGTVGGLPDALAAVDVRYLSVAHNYAGRSVPHLVGGANLPRLFRWKGHTGAEVLVWMTDTPSGMAYMEGPMLGFHDSYADVDDRLPTYLNSLATHGHPYHGDVFGWALPEESGHRDPYPWDVLHLRVQGRFADNAPPRRVIAETVRRWNETWEYPKLRLSRNEDFFTDAERRLGDQIETFEGDWGDWWVEGTGSDMRPQALTRRAQARLPQARTLNSVNRFLGGVGLRRERERSNEVYSAISMFNEHTWGAGNPWNDADAGMASGIQQRFWKNAWALRAVDGAEEFWDASTAALAQTLPRNADALASFYVTNTTTIPRSGVTELFLPESRVAEDVDVHLIDPRTGEQLRTDVLEQINLNHRNAGRRLRVFVPDVPPFGFVRLDVQPAPRRTEAAATSATGSSADGEGSLVLENAHLRVRVDLASATIASITDVATGHELVNQEATVGFNGYVYDTYVTAGGFNHASSQVVVSDKLEFLGERSLARPAALIERVSTATEDRLVYEYAAAGVRWIRVTLRLPHDSGVLHIENRLSKPSTMAKESAFLAFPFAVQDPTLTYEISGSATGTGLNEVPGAPQHMRAVRSWVSIEDGDRTFSWVTRDAHLVHPEVIALPYAPFPDSTSPREPGTIYSWVHNNIWDTNFPADQGFEMSFRYSVGVRETREQISPTGLALRTAATLTAPLEGVLANAMPTERESAVAVSLLGLSDDRVHMVDLVGGDGDDEALIRLQSFAKEPVRVRVQTGFPVRSAHAATYLGDPLHPLHVTDEGIDLDIPTLGTVAVALVLGDVGAE